MDNPNTFSDNRGEIKDLMVGEDFSITYVSFTKDAIRGNHYHNKTTQTDIVLSGKLLCRSKVGKIVNETILKKGDVITHGIGEAHAYKALESSEIVSTCLGVRIGTDYEKDVFRLETPLI